MAIAIRDLADPNSNPTPVPGAFNIEVFTMTRPVRALVGVPPPDPGFQSSAFAGDVSIVGGFLICTILQLTDGDFLVADYSAVSSLPPNGVATSIFLGSGNQTVVGAAFDWMVAGSGNQVISALLGNQSVQGGTGNDSIWAGSNDYILSGAPSNQIVVAGSGTQVVVGGSGVSTVATAASNTVEGLFRTTGNIAIAAGANNLIDLTQTAGLNAVIGSSGDTITAGTFRTEIEGAAGGMVIRVGAGGTTDLSGSTSQAAGNTVNGGNGGLNFNPGATAGKGDLIDLSGGNGTATINAFAFQATRIASPDTILGTNNADSVFGGGGDRIGTGSGSFVSGTHQWSHADTLPGSLVGFGSNDTVSSTTYDTVTGGATRGTVAGTSSAQVTVGGFNTTTDYLFYQNESAATNAAIIATAQSTTVGGAQSSIVTLPDGTVMTLVGVTQVQLSAALVAGTLFRT